MMGLNQENVEPEVSDTEDVGQEEKKRLRLVAYFNPQMFVDQRRRTEKHCQDLSEFVNELNKELAQAKKSRKKEATSRKIIRELEKKNYLDAFEVTLTPISVKTSPNHSVQSFHCKLERKEEQWKRLRRYDGFVLLLGHPHISGNGKDLALMY